MPEEISVDTSELEGLADLLDRFPQDVQSKMVKRALRDGADVFQAAIMQKVPPRPSIPGQHSNALKPGLLQADIRVAPVGPDSRGWLIGASRRTAYVLRWLEYGHQLVKGGQLSSAIASRRRRGKDGHVIGHVSAYPALRPAFDEHWKDAVHAVAIQLTQQISDYWKQTLRMIKKAS